MVQKKQLNESQLKWRANVIGQIKFQTKQMMKMCTQLMDKLKANGQQSSQCAGQNKALVVGAPGQARGSQKRQPVYQQTGYKSHQSQEQHSRLLELKAIIDPSTDDFFDLTFEQMIAHMSSYFKTGQQLKQLLDIKVPVMYSLVSETYKQLTVQKHAGHQSEDQDAIAKQNSVELLFNMSQGIL